MLFRSTLLFRKKSNTLPSHSSAKDLAEKFSQFFHMKISNIRAGLEKESGEAHPSSPSRNVSNAHLTEFQAASEDEITKVLAKSPTKSCRLDPLPTWLLKNCSEAFVPLITRIVNSSLSSHDVPTSLKEAYITPLLKKPGSDADLLKNYRPVSNLPFLSKVMERVVASRLKQHIADNNLGEPLQSAYRSGHSTETALLRVHNDLLHYVDTMGADRKSVV